MSERRAHGATVGVGADLSDSPPAPPLPAAAAAAACWVVTIVMIHRQDVRLLSLRPDCDVLARFTGLIRDSTNMQTHTARKPTLCRVDSDGLRKSPESHFCVYYICLCPYNVFVFTDDAYWRRTPRAKHSMRQYFLGAALKLECKMLTSLYTFQMQVGNLAMYIQNESE